MQPRLLEDGQVCVDMGPPTLAAAEVPTTLPATRDGGAAVAAELQVTEECQSCCKASTPCTDHAQPAHLVMFTYLIDSSGYSWLLNMCMCMGVNAGTEHNAISW